MAKREVSSSNRLYFVIFTALAVAAAVVSTSELAGATALAARAVAVFFAAVAFTSLWMDVRAPQRELQMSEIPRPSCDVNDRPDMHKGTGFPG